MQGRSPIGANLRRIISLSVVIVRAHADDPVSTERRIWHGFTLNPLSRDYWVPRLKRGMTTERFVARLKLAPMGLDPRVHLRGLDHASRVYSTCELEVPELGYTRVGWSISFP